MNAQHHGLSRSDLWPSIRASVAVVVLFAIGHWLTRHYAAPIKETLVDNNALGIAIFFASSVVAVLLPLLTNLPLVPLAVLAWGPQWCAVILLLGWVVGAALSFLLGRHARETILRRLPSIRRHAQIDRLVRPQHRLLSLVMLRMTFPVDVLSYALGMFSRSTTLTEVIASTTVGAAPFAILFSLFPTLSDAAQAAVFVGSLLAFVVYVWWVWHRPETQVASEEA